MSYTTFTPPSALSCPPQLSFSALHVPGVNNQLADALSHFQWQDFRLLAPEAQPLPTPVPPQLLTDLTSLL